MALQSDNTSPTHEPLETGGDVPRLDTPSHFPAHYTEQDAAEVLRVVEWLNRSGKPQTWLARMARMNAGTLNQVIKGSYAASPGKFLGQMLEAIASQQERAGSRDVPFVETSVYRLAVSVFHRARTYQNLGVLAGFVGTGKTSAAKEYERRTPNVYLVEGIRNMSASAFLDALVEKLSLVHEARGGSKERKFLLIVRALKGSECLVILDEAETVSPEALHYLRRIRDLARVGMVLMGTEHLEGLIKPNHGRFDQIRSRVGFWPQTISGISRQDADEVAMAAFEEHAPDAKVLDALWAICGGSIRVLVEDLVPAIRDFGLRKGRKLDAALVRQVAETVLRMAPRTSKEG